VCGDNGPLRTFDATNVHCVVSQPRVDCIDRPPIGLIRLVAQKLGQNVGAISDPSLL
jgi:hypothetical protein